MNEEDYLELQNLLTKYRIHCLKKIGNVETESQRGQIAVTENDFLVIKDIM